MKLGVVGLSQTGKTTIFNALTGARGEESLRQARMDNRIGTVRVADERIDFLTDMYKPKKTTFAQVEYLLPSAIPSAKQSENALWNQVRICDALIHVVKNFSSPDGIPADPGTDIKALQEEMIINDLMVVEKKIEKIESDLKRGNKHEQEILPLMKACKDLLDNNHPILTNTELTLSPDLRGFTFLTAKPVLIIINNDDEDDSLPELQGMDNPNMMVVRGRLEMDIATMDPDDMEEFKEEFNISDSALDRVIKRSYSLLNLMSFFTVGEDEVKAWTIRNNTPAIEAAGAIHTDIQKGFIRAEVLSYKDLKTCGTFQEAKKAGLVRLEGKEYIVKDGDIINFRFNV